MTTDRDLDVRLLAARGVPSGLPALPEEFLAYLHTTDAGPATGTPASVLAAQQLVDDAHRRRRDVGRRRPSRRKVLRIGAAVLAVAAAWTTAVLVTGPEATAPRPDDGVPAGVTLVDFDMPAYPLTLSTPPPGTTGPVFGGSGGGGASMRYTSTEDPLTWVNVSVAPDPAPPGGSVSFPGSVPEVVTVGGVPAVLVAPAETADVGSASLDWQRAPGQWVTVLAQGRYAERGLLLGIADGLVDVPQPMPVQLNVAPEGYSLDFFKDDGRVVRLGNDADPEQGLTVRLPMPGVLPTLDELSDVLDETAGPVEEVVVQGRPARLVRTDLGLAGPRGWFLEAAFPDGTTFVVEAPSTLTQDQVREIAEQVTYTP